MRCLFRFVDSHNGSTVSQLKLVETLILFWRRLMAASNRMRCFIVLRTATMAPLFPVEFGGTYFILAPFSGGPQPIALPLPFHGRPQWLHRSQLNLVNFDFLLFWRRSMDPHEFGETLNFIF